MLQPQTTAALYDTAGKFRTLFSKWGYNTFDTPVLNPASTFTAFDESARNAAVKLVDRNGVVQALRPEHTPIIASALPAYINSYGASLPLRIAYTGDVFRYDEDAHAIRQTTQAGVELIDASGRNGADSDAELCALLITSLLDVGLNDFQLDIGHSQIWHGLMKQAAMSEHDIQKACRLVDSKSIFGIEKLLSDKPISPKLKDIIVNLPHSFGDIDIIDSLIENNAAEIGDDAVGALLRLKDICGTICCYGFGGYISIDLGITRDIDYYTGFITKAYARGAGKPIGGGGRYDNLLSEFGFPNPAAGFAVDLNALLPLLASPKPPEVPEVVTYSPQNKAQAIEKATQMRKAGISVITMPLTDENSQE